MKAHISVFQKEIILMFLKLAMLHATAACMCCVSNQDAHTAHSSCCAGRTQTPEEEVKKFSVLVVLPVVLL